MEEFLKLTLEHARSDVPVIKILYKDLVASVCTADLLQCVTS
jgi:hypothetical protein